MFLPCQTERVRLSAVRTAWAAMVWICHGELYLRVDLKYTSYWALYFKG